MMRTVDKMAVFVGRGKLESVSADGSKARLHDEGDVLGTPFISE
jgi:hypothetical protein